jgi:hypothetical protein
MFPLRKRLPKKYPNNGVHMKLIIKLVPVNFKFEKLFLMSEIGISRNNANSINAKKIVIRDGLISFKKDMLFNNNPNIIEPKIRKGSIFSVKSIHLHSVIYYIFKNPLLSR